MPARLLRAMTAAMLSAAAGSLPAASSASASQPPGLYRLASSAATCGPTSGPGQAPWPQFGGDATRSGTARPGPVGAAAAPSVQLHRAWATPALDGAVYAQPLVAGGCLFAATEDDSVYAFSATTGALRWRTHLATPVAGGLPCGDISPSGITGTPVLDPVNGSLWVVVLTSGAAGPVHQAVELRSSNGQVERRQAFALPGREPAAEQERGALALEDGNLYIPLGGLFGDCNNYDGGVVSVPEAGGHSPGYWEVPTARGAGMWEPSGIDILANGELLIADGNGAAAPGQSFDGSNAVVELSPALKTEGYFAPLNWAQLNQDDGDLGSSGPAVLPGGMALQVGKAGTGYLVSTGHLGGVGNGVASLQICSGAGAFGADAVSGVTVYVPCTNGLTAVSVRGKSLHLLWHSPGGGEGSPVVAGGKVWEETPTGELFGINASTGAVVQTMNFRAPATHFPWVIAVGGALYAPDGESVIAMGHL